MSDFEQGSADWFAIRCGKWPWEWRDAPADDLMYALSLESEAARGQAMLRKRLSG